MATQSLQLAQRSFSLTHRRQRSHDPTASWSNLYQTDGSVCSQVRVCCSFQRLQIAHPHPCLSCLPSLLPADRSAGQASMRFTHLLSKLLSGCSADTGSASINQVGPVSCRATPALCTASHRLHRSTASNSHLSPLPPQTEVLGAPLLLPLSAGALHDSKARCIPNVL